jgi:hypothetical protein
VNSIIKNTLYKKIILLLLAAALIILCIVRMICVNQRYPAPSIHTADVGETLEADGITYQVRGWNVMDLEKLKETEPGIFTGYQEMIENLENQEGYSWCYVCADLTVTNHTQKTVNLSEKLCYFNCGQYANGGYFTDANGEDAELLAGETAEVKFFVNISNTMDFLKKYDAGKARIILTAYPEQYELKLE